MTYYRKMTMLMERTGIMCQCVYCRVILTPEDADNHTEADCNRNTHDMGAVDDCWRCVNCEILDPTREACPA